MAMMNQFLLYLNQNAIPSVKEKGATVKPNEAASANPISLFTKIINWVQANPILTGVIILIIIIAVVLLFIYSKKASKSKLENMSENQEIDNTLMDISLLPVNIGNTHHIGARESQQDSFGISDISNKELCDKKGVFAIVADGMGGLANGGDISAIVTSSMLKYFNENPFHSEPEIEFLNMVGTANEEVNKYLGKDGRVKGGSTVVSAILKNMQLYWLAVGDSRIYLIRNGAIIQINSEHTYGADLDEKVAMGEISIEDAQSNTQRNALTSYLGMGRLEKIDRNIRPLQLLRGDRIILMSDGVFGTLSDEEILSTMDAPTYESAARMEQIILSKNKSKQDNFTAVILECV
jgi:serine/threonine protein phosphatase PrpC